MPEAWVEGACQTATRAHCKNGGTGNHDPEAGSGTEPHKVLLGCVIMSRVSLGFESLSLFGDGRLIHFTTWSFQKIKFTFRSHIICSFLKFILQYPKHAFYLTLFTRSVRATLETGDDGIQEVRQPFCYFYGHAGQKCSPRIVCKACGNKHFHRIGNLLDSHQYAPRNPLITGGNWCWWEVWTWCLSDQSITFAAVSYSLRPGSQPRLTLYGSMASQVPRLWIRVFTFPLGQWAVQAMWYVPFYGYRKNRQYG